MSKFLRLAAGVLCIALLALGAVFFDPACLLTRPAPWDPELRDSMAETMARRERLIRLHESSFRRVEAKWQIAREVVAERRSLGEAIELFRELDGQWPELRSVTKRPEELWMAEDEWDGWVVIQQVQQVLADRPEEATAVSDRLEKQLQRLLADRKKRPPAPVDLPTEQRR